MSVTTRNAEANDLPALIPLFDGYRQFYQQASDPAAAGDFLGQRFSRKDSVILLAEHDGTPIGFTQLYPMFSSVRMARVWILNDLFVADGHRQRGAGRRLLEAAEAFAQADGAVALQLETQTTNTIAQALYTELGWEMETEAVWFRLPLGN